MNILVEDTDRGDVPGNLDAVEADLKAAALAATSPAPAPAAAPVSIPADNTPVIPEKYRGKSTEEVIQMHQNLESLYGRMANDVGNQRAAIDQLLELKRSEDLTTNSPQPLPEITSGDLLDNPNDAIGQVVEAQLQNVSGPVVDRLSALEQNYAKDACLRNHSDLDTVTASPEFTAWLSKSPMRQQYANAAAQGDWGAADTLLTDYKDYAAYAAPTTNTDDPADTTPTHTGLDAAREAGFESGHASNGATTGAVASGKIHYRADLIELKLRKPETYNNPAFQAEIVRAYQEGRVK